MKDKLGNELVITDKTRPVLRSDRFGTGKDALTVEVLRIEESFIEIRQRRTGEQPIRISEEDLLRSAWVRHGTVKIGEA